MILMVMRNQHAIDHFGQILIGIARDVVLVGVAEHGVGQNAGASSFKQDAGMAKISPSGGAAVIGLIFSGRTRTQETRKHLVVLIAQAQPVFDLRKRRWSVFQLEKEVDLVASKRNGEMHISLLLKSRGAKHKWPVIARDEREHNALQLRIVEVARVQERLQQSKRDVVVQVIHQFHVSLKKVGNNGIKWFKRVPLGIRTEHRIELADGLR